MSIIKRVAKNTSSLLLSQIISYVFVFFGTMYTARYLGAGGYGILSTGIAITSIFAVIGDLGLGSLTVREVARNKSLTNKYVVNTTLIKSFLSIIMLVLIVITTEIINYSPEISNIIYILTLSIIFNTFSGVFGSIFQAYEKMEYVSIAGIIISILTFIGFIMAIYFNLGIVKFAFVYLIVSIINLVYLMAIFIWKFFLPKINGDWKFWKNNIKADLNFWKYLLMQALPLSIAIVFSVIIFKIDTILLSILKGSAVVGWYTVAYNILQALFIVPTAFTTSIFPLLSTFHISSKESLKLTYQKSFKYLTILGIPTAVGITLLADKIILLVYTQEFIPAIIALQILVWTVPFIFLTILFGAVVTSINRQNLLMKILFIVMIFNIILNLILIPQFSYIGSAIATVLSELVTFILFFKFLSNYVCRFSSRDAIFKTIIASGIMSLFIIYASINVLFVIPIAIIIYFVTLILLNTFSKDEIDLFRQIFEVKK
ncbi:flippase [Methanobacterium sp.]|uniref:flippase n=1 Tax=Methanobacterium sp. TaxID=2164 RepID=UPI003C78A0D3